MVCCGPVPQTVQDEILHHRVIAVDRIAAAAEVIVVSLRRQHVIDVIVKALEGNHGTVTVSLCRVVKHHVQDALDAALMKLPDEFFQFMALVVVFLLRCIEIGISVSDLDLLTVGLVLDIWTEKTNDGVKYARVASQEDFDKF